LIFGSSFAFLQVNYLILFHIFTTNMDKQHHHSSRSRSERMEDDLNRSSYNKSGSLSGWPTPDKAPRTSRADSCGPSPAQPQKAIPVIQDPPKEGNAAKAGPVAAPSQVGPADGFCVDGQGGEAQNDLVHGASYGGLTPTRKNSSLVDDDEAAARLEWEYQSVQRQASRTHSHRDTGGRPRSGVWGYVPRSSLDDRQGESRSSRETTHMMDVMTRMERQLAASTAAIATMTAAHASTSGPGEYISFLL
jgi:hypothetical protein